MLSKKERLSRSEFQSLLLDKKLITVYNSVGTLKYTPTLSSSFSIVTSSRHEKHAVARNRLRRRIYTLYKQSKVTFRGILYVSKQSYQFDYDTIKKLFNELMEKTTKTS